MSEYDEAEPPHETGTLSFMDWMLSSHATANALILFLILLVGMSFAGVGVFATHRIRTTDTITTVAATVLSPVQAIGNVASQAVSAGTHMAFTCESGKWVDALFSGTVVNLSLSDGRSLALPGAPSSAGTRFSNPDGSFIFEQNGTKASVTERGVATYASCTAL